jgi:pyrimidine-nucleoside phosphorylase
MRAVDVIRKKRDGEELTEEEIEFMVVGFTEGVIPDYQMSAWLMAIVWRGMSERETLDLTMAMAHSGDVLDLSSVAPLVVDKHSTGGVGDKTTLVVAPLVACCGLPIGKMSGRGLGFSGGTLDKLEAIPGLSVDLSRGQFIELLKQHGIVVAGQSRELAPADGKMYSLRDVTATVPSLPLIASSIMSKKIASGSSAIVLDVKVGRGAFMKSEREARELARIMVALGRQAGRRMTAVISDMEQPLGYAVGNALEVAEAIRTLQGRGPADFTEHALVMATEILLLAGVCDTQTAGRHMLQDKVRNGEALAKFREWVKAQGGDDRVIDDLKLMPQARLVEALLSPVDGFVSAIDAMQVGLAAVALGAGRQKKGDHIDHAVGVVLNKKVGDPVQEGELLLTIHANSEQQLAEARQQLLSAYTWSDAPVEVRPLIRDIIR